MKNTALLYLLLIPLLLSGVQACHSDQPALQYSIHHHPVTDNNGEEVYFFLSKMAWLPAKGIARFPDGGIPRYLMEEVSLCCINTSDPELREIVTFEDLTAFIGPYRSSWSTHLLHTGTSVWYKAGPAGGFSSLEARTPAGVDSLVLQKLHRKYDRWYRYCPNSGPVPAALQDSTPEGWQGTDTLRIAEADSLLSLLPLAESGFILQEIYPKPEEEYIQDLIYLRNPSALARRAIAEQVIAPMDQNSIRRVLEEMKEEAARRTGLDSLEYTLRTREAKDYLTAILRKRKQQTIPGP